MGIHAEPTRLPQPRSLIGTWRRFGMTGPLYEIVGLGRELAEGDREMRVRVVRRARRSITALPRSSTIPKSADVRYRIRSRRGTDAEASPARGRAQAYADIKSLLAGYGFDWVQGSLYVSATEDLTKLFAAIMALKAMPWFPPCVRDIRAFRVEQWSDFTSLVKT